MVATITTAITATITCTFRSVNRKYTCRIKARFMPKCRVNNTEFVVKWCNSCAASNVNWETKWWGREDKLAVRRPRRWRLDRLRRRAAPDRDPRCSWPSHRRTSVPACLASSRCCSRRRSSALSRRTGSDASSARYNRTARLRDDQHRRAIQSPYILYSVIAFSRSGRVLLNQTGLIHSVMFHLGRYCSAPVFMNDTKLQQPVDIAGSVLSVPLA